MNNSLQQAKDFLLLLQKKTRIELQLKEINKDLYDREQCLFDSMIEEGVPSLSLDMGTESIKFEPKVDTDFSLDGPVAGRKWDDIGMWFDWLREIGEDGLIKTKESVNAQTRKAFLKEYTEKGNMLPDFIKESPMNKVKYNKSALERSVKNETPGK